jgi:hypothetical protein
LPLQYLLPFIGTFEDVQLRLGIGWGLQPLREPPSSGPSELCVGFDFPFILFYPSSSYYYYSSSSASSSTSLRLRLHSPRYALSLCFSFSHYYLSRSLYISLSSLRVSPRMSLQ